MLLNLNLILIHIKHQLTIRNNYTLFKIKIVFLRVCINIRIIYIVYESIFLLILPFLTYIHMRLCPMQNSPLFFHGFADIEPPEPCILEYHSFHHSL